MPPDIWIPSYYLYMFRFIMIGAIPAHLMICDILLYLFISPNLKMRDSWYWYDRRIILNWEFFYFLSISSIYSLINWIRLARYLICISSNLENISIEFLAISLNYSARGFIQLSFPRLSKHLWGELISVCVTILVMESVLIHLDSVCTLNEKTIVARGKTDWYIFKDNYNTYLSLL